MQYTIQYACVSSKGRVRHENQDNFYCDGCFLERDDAELTTPFQGALSSRSSPVLAVFDGMGGEQCGEIASYLAAREAAILLGRKNSRSLLERFFQAANARICAYADENGVGTMGTTAAMLLFTKKQIFLGNIGDSKVLRFSDGMLEQISKDHVAVSVFGVKPPLSQSLGVPPDQFLIEPYYAQGPYHHGEVFVICSDGLTDMLNHQEMSQILAETRDIGVATARLLDSAMAKGGKDNITIILCKVQRKLGKLMSFYQRVYGEEDEA